MFEAKRLSKPVCRETVPAQVERLEGRRLLSSSYYLSPTGSDSNAGTSAGSAWKTLSRANAQSYKPGDSLLLQGGASFAGKLILTAADAGTQASPVTISSYGTGRGVITAGSGDGIDVTDAGGINIINVNVEGDGTNVKTSTGINLLDDLGSAPRIGYITINQVDVGGFGAAGIGINSTTVTTGFTNVNVTLCTVHNNGHSGIWSQAGPDVSPAPYGLAHQNIYIGFDTVCNNLGYSGTDASGNGIQLGNANASTIQYCLAYGNGSKNSATGGGPVGIWTYNSNNIVIQFNVSYSNTAVHIDGDGFDLDGGTTNSFLQYNYSHDNGGCGILEAQFAGGSTHSGNTIRYNISQNDGRKTTQCGIELWAASASDTIQGSQIYGNTIYMVPASSGSPSGILILSATKNVAIRNNLIDMASGLDAIVVKNVGTGLVLQGNDYWTGSASAIGVVWGSKTYQTLASWRSATGEEILNGTATGLAVNPMLSIASSTGIPSKNDVITGSGSFRLQKLSPLSSAGINLWSLGINPGPIDFFSDPLGTKLKLSIGAD